MMPDGMGPASDWRIGPPAFDSIHRPVFCAEAHRPLRGSGRYYGRGRGSGPFKAPWDPTQIHIFVIRDISKTTGQTGKRDILVVEPTTGSDVSVCHASD